MATFVKQDSIVRSIWGKADTVLFIFAGSAAEFAVNKAVDWLYFTGKLPADPLGRLFSTVAYARQIIFSDYEDAIRAIDKITAIHQGVEQARGAQIPDWAYRDVLFMLIDYSIRSFELLERQLTIQEKAEVFDVFYRVGAQMNLTGLPASYLQWELMRAEHLHHDLVSSEFTIDLYRQYKKHLGSLRYFLLKQVQILVCPPLVKKLLKLGNIPIMWPALIGYKFLRWLKLENGLKNALLPEQYKAQIIALNI
ncbi:oxygenase MpaB family protein [Mucilaginibacter boryungensis]|uniref:DUF2236 domain-containing protein n=1 Tax=Mucilaginibacter boryungensis TaxID=768480 RepID=A0ABR9XI83_9SPHI|nr:oxygenase MpaB family protein [Mucilaginibacter boryungensis]MBE9666789.1 DUF2236 domain-containing protein [Mucilaginibacter boryungensis]